MHSPPSDSQRFSVSGDGMTNASHADSLPATATGRGPSDLAARATQADRQGATDDTGPGAEGEPEDDEYEPSLARTYEDLSCSRSCSTALVGLAKGCMPDVPVPEISTAAHAPRDGSSCTSRLASLRAAPADWAPECGGGGGGVRGGPGPADRPAASAAVLAPGGGVAAVLHSWIGADKSGGRPRRPGRGGRHVHLPVTVWTSCLHSGQRVL